MEAYTTGGSTTEEESTVRYYEPIKMPTAGTSSEKDTSAPSTSPAPAERTKKARKEEEERPIEVRKVEQIEAEPEMIMTKSMGVDPMEKVDLFFFFYSKVMNRKKANIFITRTFEEDFRDFKT